MSDPIIEAKQKLVAAGRRRYVLDVDRARLRKEIGVPNLEAARALLRELNTQLEDLKKTQRVLLRKIEKRIGNEDR